MFSMEELYRAYRKAKHEAFSDATQPANLEFASYEQKLTKNLKALKALLENKRNPWYTRKSLVTGFAYLTKSITAVAPSSDERAHFTTGDQTLDWVRTFCEGQDSAAANFRLIIVPTVDFQIISALWVMQVGRIYDAALNDKVVYGNRPRKAISASIENTSIKDDSFALFKPYFSGYKAWRENGLRKMREAAKSGETVIAVTMDAKNYYHSISPRFLLSGSFLDRNKIELTKEQKGFTVELVDALELWFRNTPEYKGSPVGSVAVGLSASKIIANVLLAEFDREVLSKLDCEYYGRYVDDVFLVLKGGPETNAADVMKFIQSRMSGVVAIERDARESVGLRLVLPYLGESEVVFAGSKQKIFLVKGDHGTDLVRQISDQIRKASSEYRLIPSLNEVDQVLTNALLASSDAAAEPDTLRKAEAMSIRRHGLSIATRNLESYARDVEPSAWLEKRLRAYGLILRHVATPVGLFQYSKYLTRVFGVMIACSDWTSATEILDKVNEVLLSVRSGIDASLHDNLLSFRDVLRRGFLEAAVSASTVEGFKYQVDFRRLLRRLDPDKLVFERNIVTEAAARSLSKQLLLADLGQRPYKDYWYNDNPSTPRQPRLPEVPFIKQMWDLLAGLKKHIVRDLNDPFWPAFAFATRPPTLSEMCLMMPGLLKERGGLAKALLAIRGAGVPIESTGLRLVSDRKDWTECEIPNLRFQGKVSSSRINVAVPSYLTTEKQWSAALRSRPDLSVARYEALTSLINSIIQRSPHVNYIALPECSVPFPWAFSIAKNLARSGISFICGIEPNPKRKRYRNDALVSLVTTFGGYRSSLIFRQPKLQLAHEEARQVRKRRLRFSPPPHPSGRPIYVHGNFIFSVLLCSDLTNIENRTALQGEIDALFVLEWNPDVDTFSYLVESSAHDLHAPIVQVNNRLYGDSRVRAPYKLPYKRDVLRVKGGDANFYALASFDHQKLRKYQANPRLSSKSYKPLPIGYKLSKRRGGVG